MSPLYKDNEFLFCQSDFEPASLKEGDCAVYELSGGLYLHRIKRKEENGFYFGNLDDLPEHFVPFSQIKYLPCERKIENLFLILIYPLFKFLKALLSLK